MTDRLPSFSFVHAADLHLDTPFHGVQASAPHVAEALRDASLHAFDAIVALALERQVAFVVFAGDIYDGAERGIRAQLRFFAGLEKLADAGIQSFVVHGNHDPVESGWSAVSNGWPKMVTIFGSDDTQPAPVVNIERDGQRVATVQGMSYAQRETHENLSRRFSRPEGPGIHIGLLHCNVEGSPSKYANYSPCTLGDLRTTKLDYLALGHVHDRRILLEGNPHEPWVIYPGNTQARSINETGPKGVYLVNVEGGVIETPSFIPCDSIRFYQREIAIDDCASLGDLLDRLRTTEQGLLAESARRSIVVRATLTGRSALHRSLTKQGALDDLLSELRSDSSISEPFCWWERVIDLSSSPFDLDEIRQRSDFSADLLDLSDSIISDEAQGAGLFEDLASSLAKTLRADLDQLLSQPAFRTELLHAAQLQALDELAGDQ